MKRVLTRIWISLKKEGFWQFSIMLGRFLLKQAGFIGSETYVYKRSIENFSYDQNSYSDLDSDYNLLICRSSKDLPPLTKVSKLDALPSDDWFDRGATCLILEKKNHLVAYAWLHEKYYDNLGKAGILNLFEHEAFVGPFYTDPEHRNKGLYYYMMDLVLAYHQKEGGRTVFGTSNAKNIATIKVLVRKGFDIIGMIRVTGQKKKIILELTQDNLVGMRID